MKEIFSIIRNPTAFPMFARRESSDLDSFHQVFIDQEYAPLLKLLDQPKLIIDCGANAGYSSIFFLWKFPGCDLIAVEPDPQNHALLERNLAPYASRAKVLNAAVWSERAHLVLESEPYRGGAEWTRQVRPASTFTDDSVLGLTLEDLLAASEHERISLLKMDIEGAEAEVFRQKPTWLERVDAIAIELHDDSHFGPASERFHAAVSEQEFTYFESLELTICIRKEKAITLFPEPL